MNAPLYLKDFIIHKNIAKKLSAFTEYVPHTVFVGPPSAGKKTLIYAMINNIHNNTIAIQKYRTLKFDDITVNGNLIPINYIQSPYHFEFSLSEYGLCDIDVITHYINKIIEYKTIDNTFRIIIIHHIDRLSVDTQKALLSLLDKYILTSRFFFITHNIQSLHFSFKSRIFTIRVPFPTNTCIYKHIQYIIPQLTSENIDKIIQNSNNSMFTIYNILPLIKQCIDTSPNSIITDTKLMEIVTNSNIQSVINILLPHILEKNIISIKTIRRILYDFILSNINVNDIFNEIVNYIMQLQILPISSRHEFLQDIINYTHYINKIEYNIIILELLIFKVKKLLQKNNV